MMLVYQRDSVTMRQTIDDWLVSPLDPRQAEAEARFGREMMGGVG